MWPFKWDVDDGDTKLALLRTNPESTLLQYVFLVDIAKGVILNSGNCSVKCVKVKDKIYKLILTNNSGSDWYFPFVTNGLGGVGSCEVPIPQNNGALAISTGMNGCALQVNKNDGKFIFFHDSDGTSLGKITVQGECVCRVEYRDYAGPFYSGEKFLKEKKFGDGYFSYYPICVHHENKWKVFYSGVYHSPVSNKYEKLYDVFPCKISFYDE